jgi:hypothetical protein
MIQAGIDRSADSASFYGPLAASRRGWQIVTIKTVVACSCIGTQGPSESGRPLQDWRRRLEVVVVLGDRDAKAGNSEDGGDSDNGGARSRG